MRSTGSSSATAGCSLRANGAGGFGACVADGARVRAAVRKPARARALRPGGRRVSRGGWRARVRRSPCHRPGSPDRTAKTVTLRTSSYSYRLRTANDEGSTRPRLLVVTPFAVFPPRHGGARRVAELLRGLRSDFDIALVTDEAALYDARSFAYFDGLREIHFVQREGARTGGRRVASRAHAIALPSGARCRGRGCAAFDFQPDLVAVEHAELADAGTASHTGDALGPRLARRVWSRRFRGGARTPHGSRKRCAPTMRSPCAPTRTARCLRTRASSASRMAARWRRTDYRPSGSERAAVHRALSLRAQSRGHRALSCATRGRRFERPRPRRALLILGGDEHAHCTAGEPAFARAGVQVVGHRDDVPALLAAMHAHDQPARAESAARRSSWSSRSPPVACASTTAAGARGFAIGAPPGFVIVPDVAAMAGADHRLARSIRSAAMRSKRPRPARWTATRGNMAWHGFRLSTPICCEPLAPQGCNR